MLDEQCRFDKRKADMFPIKSRVQTNDLKASDARLLTNETHRNSLHPRKPTARKTTIHNSGVKYCYVFCDDTKRKLSPMAFIHGVEKRLFYEF